MHQIDVHQIDVRPSTQTMKLPPARYPRIASVASASPANTLDQRAAMEALRFALLGADWESAPESAESARRIEKLFAASGVRERQSVINFDEFYSQPRTTGERFAEYARTAPALGRAAIESCLAGAADACAPRSPADISDFIVVSSTGYSSPGLDIQLARDMGMPNDVRRLIVGHMGCFGAVVGLRQALGAMRAYPGGNVMMLCLELSSLHFAPSLHPERLTCMSLFGDAAGALLLTDDPVASGPELIDTYCGADFSTAGQMSLTITDEGLAMTLSPRVPVSLRRNVGEVAEKLLARNGLSFGDIDHWLVHPGGPSIMDAVAQRLSISDEQMEVSRQVLADHGNCVSATILLVLQRYLAEGRAQPGEWGVMMSFGPGLTIEMCLLRF